MLKDGSVLEEADGKGTIVEPTTNPPVTQVRHWDSRHDLSRSLSPPRIHSGSKLVHGPACSVLHQSLSSIPRAGMCFHF